MFKTGDIVANETIMTRMTYKDTIFIIEGYDDTKALQKFTRDPNAVFIPAWGKDNAIDATSFLDREDIRGILTIIDADFWHLDGRQSPSPNLLITDEHDLEMMIIRSDSFNSFIRELASKNKVAMVLAEHGVDDVREILLGRALYVGYLRRYSEMNALQLCFKGVRFDRFIDRETLELDSDILVENILALSRNPSLKKSHLINVLEDLVTECSDDPYQVCCGHDFIAILGIGLKKVLGSKSKEAASPGAISSDLRLSYDYEDFKNTCLYIDAKKWEEINSGFATFK